jgi:phosphoglycerol transferase MdoB-like AlkP superfamily enzyme
MQFTWDFLRFSSEKQANRARWLFFVAFYAVFANVPFWAASPVLGLEHTGLFGLEYAGLGLLALFLPGILSAALLLLVIAADVILGLSQTYWLPPRECLSNFGVLNGLSITRFLSVVMLAVVILLVLGCATVFPIAKIRGVYRLRAAACLFAFVAILASIDFVAFARETGQAPNPFRIATANDANNVEALNSLRLSRLPVVQLVRHEIIYARLHSIESTAQGTASSIPSAASLAAHYAVLASNKGNQEKPNLVVILVESWGLSTDSAIRSAEVQPYFQPGLLDRYQVLQGTVPFYGPTVSGEARELCASKMGFHLINASTQELQGCLPDRLATQGYHNIALHGMDQHMFSRSTWYNRIGFQEKLFRDEFRRQGLADCPGAFSGTCDASIAEWIGSRLETKDSNPDFVYWVTLNSHLPVPVPPQLQAGASCSLTSLLSREPALCSWYQLTSNVHLSVSKLAMKKLARPTIFVIVGDHAPPFANSVLRGQFSGAVVPYVLLVPRQKNHASVPPS